MTIPSPDPYVFGPPRQTSLPVPGPREIHPLYVDGPLKGRDNPVSYDRNPPCQVQAYCSSPARLHLNVPVVSEDKFQLVTYQLSRLALTFPGDYCWIWIAYSGTELPSGREFTKMILSGAALRAIET